MKFLFFKKMKLAIQGVARKNIRATQYGIESVSNLGVLLSGEIKIVLPSPLLNKMRKWIPKKFRSMLCQKSIKMSRYI